MMDEKESAVPSNETSTEAAADVYVDHRETVIQVHDPPTLSVAKKEVTSETDGIGAEDETIWLEPEVTPETEKQQEAATVTTITQHATSIYTRKIGGWQAGRGGAGLEGVLLKDQGGGEANGEHAEPRQDFQQDGGSADQTDVVNNNSVVQASGDAVAEVRKEVCSIEVSVGGDPSSPTATSTTTTTAFSKVFGKTVDTDAATTIITTTTVMETVETSLSKERHLSQCSISIPGRDTSSIVEEAGQDSAFSKATADESQANGEEEKEEKKEEGERGDGERGEGERAEGERGKEQEDKVAGYHPGLAIRALTLEGLLEKRLSPDRESASSDQTTSSLIKNTVNDLSTLAASDKPNDTCAISQAKAGGAVAQALASAGESSVSGEALVSGCQLGTAATTAELGVRQDQRPQHDSYTASGHLLTQCTDDAQAAAMPLAASSKPLFNPIEVERKFSIDDNTEARLRALGAQLRVEKTFHDVYYDNDNYTLILNDCWLRRRNDVWEARVPAKSAAAAAGTGNAQGQPPAQYRELSSEKAVSAWLVETLGLDAWLKGDPMDLVVQAAGLSDFTHVVTTRRSYTLPSCTVDLDLTDHGFRVGEIEVMAAAPDDVPRALKTISRVAEQLGLSLLKLA